jgi:hypothetical protein
MSSFIWLLLTRGLAELFFGVWQSRRMHHRSGRRRQVARLCVPYIRGPRLSQRSHDQGTLPRRKGRPCTYYHLKRPLKLSDMPSLHRSTRNAQSHGRSTCATRAISSADWHRTRLRIQCGRSLPNMERWLTPRLWWTGRRAGRRDLGLSRLKITAMTLSSLESLGSFSMISRCVLRSRCSLSQANHGLPD